MTPVAKAVLAIDLGTSGAKAAVVCEDGRLLSVGRARVDTQELPDLGAEQDPEAIWSACVQAGRQAVAGADAEILAVATCSQYSSIVPIDKDGRAAMNLILWRDQRGRPEALARLPGARGLPDGLLRKLRWLRIHGVPPLDSGVDALAHMRFIMLARPEVYARTWKFLEPVDYLGLRLTGRAAATPCSTFMMLLVDNRRPDSPRYHPTLLRYSGLDPDKLPELVPSGERLGTLLPEVAEELGLTGKVAVWTGINDTHAGAMGSLAFKGSHAAVSIGTTSVMVTHVDFKRTDVRSAIASAPSPLPGTYLVLAENGIGGRAVEHFLEKLVFSTDGFGDHGLEHKFEALERAVAQIEPGSQGVLFLPWLAGSLSPSEDVRVRGGFLNLSLQTTREHMGRAVLEGVALNLRWLRGAVERFAKRRFSHLFFYGGGAVSELWSQIIADVHRLPVHQAAEPEYTACRGVGLLALSRQGLIALSDFDRLVPVRRVLEPRPGPAERYDALFAQFVRAFKANRRIFHALNP